MSDLEMSGICGIVGPSSNVSDIKKIGGAMRASKYGSTHFSNFFVGDNVAFYSTHKDQLVFNEEGGVCCAVNGDIYNASEVRRFLEDRGHRFISDNENEVFVHLYEESFNERYIYQIVNGVFSLAIWDSVNKTFVLCADKLTFKQLYYAIMNDALIFSSEIKSILNFDDKLRSIDSYALDLYLSYSFTPSHYTLIEGVKKMLPMTYYIFNIDNNNTYLDNTVRYFSFDFTPIDMDLDMLCDHIYRLLLCSITKRTKDATSIGVSLSGGLDSSLICSLSNSIEKDVYTFTLACEGGEQDKAQLVADFIGSEHSEIPITSDDYIKNVGKVSEVFDEPLPFVGTVMSYVLIEEAKNYVDQIVTGEGGDELFFGYPYLYYSKFWFDRILHGRLHRISDATSSVSKIRNILHRRFSNPVVESLFKKFVSTPQHFFMEQFQQFEQEDLASLYSHYENGIKNPSINILSYPIKELCEKVTVKDNLLRKYYPFYELVLPGSEFGIRRPETICNHFNLKLAYPILDDEVTTLCFRIPTYLKHPRKDMTKYILRKMILKNKLLPANIVKLEKRGLGNIPINNWLKNNYDFNSYVFDILEEGINMKLYTRELIDRLGKSLPTNAYKAFILSAYVLWFKQNILK